MDVVTLVLRTWVHLDPLGSTRPLLAAYLVLPHKCRAVSAVTIASDVGNTTNHRPICCVSGVVREAVGILALCFSHSASLTGGLPSPAPACFAPPTDEAQ